MGGSRRYCGQCGQEVKQGAQYCATCGHAVAAPPKTSAADETDTAPRGIGGPGPRPTPPWDQPAYGPDGTVYPPDDPAFPAGGSPSRATDVTRPATGAAHPPPPPASAYPPPPAPPPPGPPPGGSAYPPPAEGPNYPPPGSAYPPPTGSGYPPPPGGPDYPPPAGPAYPLPADSAYPPPTGPAYPLPAGQAYPPPPGSASPASATDTAQFPSNWLDNVGFSPQWEQQPSLPLDPVDPERRASQRRKVMIIGLVSLLAAVIVVPALLILHAFSGLTGGSKTPPPAAAKSSPGTARVSAQQAARNLNGLLAQSVTDRRSVELAVSDVNHCGPALGQDPQTFRAHASSRQRLLRQLQSLPGRSALPSSMIRELTSAWQASMTVDDDLAQWAQDEAAKGCKKNDHHDPNLAAAAVPNKEATADKTAFVEMWNPIAEKYALTPYRTSQL